MKFYVYRREDVPALDFSVRRASSEGPAFEFCDVLASGVAFGAGIRTGDRPTGVMGADTSASKNPHNWDEQSLGVLREAEAGTLFVLFVDKRVPLSRREGQHMKKRAEFISARKSNLKKLGRLDELATFVMKWDNKNGAEAKEGHARAEREVHVQVKKEGQARAERAKAPQSTRSRSGPQIIRMCVYDAEFSVRPVEGEQYEIYGVAEGSVAYQVGIRDGDFACGFKHYNEDGRSKSHAWCEDTLDELKDIGVFFIDVLKNPPFGKAALRDCMKREKYVSKIKSRLGSTIEAEEFLVRVRSWDHFQVKSMLKDAGGVDATESRVEDVTVGQTPTRGIIAGCTTTAAEPDNENDSRATPSVHLANEDDDKPSQLPPEDDFGVGFLSAGSLEKTRPPEEDTRTGCIYGEERIMVPASPHPQVSVMEQHAQEMEMPEPEAPSPAARVNSRIHHDLMPMKKHEALVDKSTLILQEGRKPSSSQEDAAKVYPRPPTPTEARSSESAHSSKHPSNRRRTETALDAAGQDLRVGGFIVGVPKDDSAISEDGVWIGGNSESDGGINNKSDDNAVLPGDMIAAPSAGVNARAPESASAPSSLVKRANEDQRSEGSGVAWRIRKRTKTCVKENGPRNVDLDEVDGSRANTNLQDVVDPVEAPEYRSANRASAFDAAKKLLVAVASKPRLKRLIKFPNWERRVLELLNRPTEQNTTIQLRATIGLLCKARLKPDSSDTVDICVDWVVKTLECLPLRDGYSVSMSIPVDTVQHSVVHVKDKMAEAKKGSGSARQVMLAWKAATDCIVEAVSAFKECVLHQQQQSREWRLWLESMNEHVLTQRVEISRIVEESKGMVTSFEAAAAIAKQKMESLEESLKTEIDKAEENIASRHRQHAIAGDFDNCARYRYTHVKTLSADQHIASLHEVLTRYHKKVRVSEKKTTSARESLAFWQSLQELCDVIQREHAAQVKVALSKLAASTEAFQRQVKQGLSWIGEVLIDALERYFKHSFRVQENALDRVEKLRLEKEEHDAKFGGYFAFDDSGMEVYTQVVAQSKAEDREVIQSQLSMWRDLMQSMPEFGPLFAFASLDEELSEAHGRLWAEIKKPLQKAIDGLFLHSNRDGFEASRVLPCDQMQQVSSDEESGVSLVVQTSSAKRLPRSKVSAMGVGTSESKAHEGQLGVSVSSAQAFQEVEDHAGMTAFVVDDSVANADFNALSENGCSIT